MKFTRIEVPNLDFSGWYDYCGGTMAHLKLMQQHARTDVARDQTKLIITPGNHGGTGKRKLGEIDYGPQAEFDKNDIMLRWFDYWLRGVANGMDHEPACKYFVMGSLEWKSADTWPPDGIIGTTYYLHSNGVANPINSSGTLSTEAPALEVTDSYTYDPVDPMPTLWGCDLFTLPSNRRLVEHRPDILYYLTPALVEEVEIVGYPKVVLYASSSAVDTDFFARLVDNDPKGLAIEVCYGMVRARHRNSLEVEELIEPGTVYEFRIKLGPTACRFLKGHRIRLEITSSDFPNHDRNHNTGRDDLADVELCTAEQKVYHSSTYPSRLLLPVSSG